MAPELIGKLFVRQAGGCVLSGRIVEVEAYMGSEDPASHAFRGRTARNACMFGPPGHLYVYVSYGVHYCANAVTSEEDVATAVLFRALEPVEGIETMMANRGVRDVRKLCSGPGRLCQALSITTDYDGIDLLSDELHIADDGVRPDVITTGRVGITVAAERPWRFLAPGNRFASRARARSG